MLLGIITLVLNVPLLAFSSRHINNIPALFALWIPLFLNSIAGIYMCWQSRKFPNIFGWLIGFNFVYLIIAFYIIADKTQYPMMIGYSVFCSLTGVLSAIFGRKISDRREITGEAISLVHDDISVNAELAGRREKTIRILSDITKRNNRHAKAMQWMAVYTAVLIPPAGIIVFRGFEARPVLSIARILFVLVSCAGSAWLASFFQESARKALYTGNLVFLGIPVVEAMRTAEEEYRNKTLGTCAREWWHDYYSRNRGAIDDFSKQFYEHMAEKYQVNSEWLQAFMAPDGDVPVRIASFYYRGQTVAQAAEDMHKSLPVKREMDKKNIIYKPDPTAETEALNKKGEKSERRFLLYGFLALAGYGGGPMFLGSNALDIFVPSAIWHRIGWGICFALAAGITFWLLDSEKARARRKERGTTMPQLIFGIAVFSLFLLFTSDLAIIQGAGKLATNLFGIQDTQTFFVSSKAPAADNREEHDTTRCIMIKGISQYTMFYEYCRVSPSDYNALPKTGKTPLVFQVHKSFFGVTLQGYGT